VEQPDFDPAASISAQLRHKFPNEEDAAYFEAFLPTNAPEQPLQQIFWGITNDGAILSLQMLRPADATVDDLVRAFQDGWNDGDPAVIYLQAGLLGRGNGYLTWQAIAEFASDEGARLLFDAACLAILKKTKGSVDGVRFKRERAVAEVWVRGQGIDSPLALRNVVDKKNSWKPKALATRLRITNAFAKELLTRLGYAPDYPGAPWCRSDLPQALRNRAVWMEEEDPRIGQLSDPEEATKWPSSLSYAVATLLLFGVPLLLAWFAAGNGQDDTAGYLIVGGGFVGVGGLLLALGFLNTPSKNGRNFSTRASEMGAIFVAIGGLLVAFLQTFGIAERQGALLLLSGFLVAGLAFAAFMTRSRLPRNDPDGTSAGSSRKKDNH
jgi:hypothetical protein